MSRNFLLFFAFLVFVYTSVSQSNESKFGVDMAIFSIGTWGSIAQSTDDVTEKNSYFTSLKSDIYYHLFGLNGHIGFPLTLTWEDYGASGKGEDTVDAKWAFYPADLSMYIGKNVGSFQPRVGIEFPMGYPTGDVAWIGSKNLKLILGSGFSLPSFFQKKLSIGGELMGRIFLTGDVGTNSEEDGDRIEKGSYSLYLAIKGSYQVTTKVHTGLEFLPYYSYYTKTNWTNNPEEFTRGEFFKSFGFIPILFGSYLPHSKMEISLKGSYGWELNEDGKKLEPSETKSITYANVVYVNLGFNFYFW